MILMRKSPSKKPKEVEAPKKEPPVKSTKARALDRGLGINVSATTDTISALARAVNRLSMSIVMVREAKTREAKVGPPNKLNRIKSAEKALQAAQDELLKVFEEFE